MPKRDKYLFVVAGPTAVGKTAIALELSRRFKAPIISADSRQIYKEMNIGTAKPTHGEIERAPILLVDHVSVSETYSAGKFETEAIQKLEEIHKDNDVAILCGGTGLYIDAVLFGLDNFPKIDESIIQELEHDLQLKGIEVLRKELEEKDPDYYSEVDLDNPRRILRALSVIRQTGQSFSSFRKASPKKRSFQVKGCVLEMPREDLYERINLRVDKMITSGLVEEVKFLLPFKNLKALQTVGYQELFPYLEDKISLEEALDEIKKFSRRYAKRQITWLKRYDWPRFHPADIENITKYFEE